MNLLLADHAGSGKTLAYLLPMIQRLRNDEKHAKGKITEPNNPRAVVIAPTAGEFAIDNKNCIDCSSLFIY